MGPGNFQASAKKINRGELKVQGSTLLYTTSVVAKKPQREQELWGVMHHERTTLVQHFLLMQSHGLP